jgi:arylsulfatase A-like enzyme
MAAALSLLSVTAQTAAPNLVFILTDDMGYGSVFNGATIIPHLDALKSEGVTADMYSYRFCSPTRAAFLTGRYPWRITSTICDGRVCNYLPATIPMGTHLGYSMLPQRLKEKGYVSYHVGKWHEGLYAPQFTPTYRGFNRSNGFLSGGEDHYTLAADLGVGACDGKVSTRDAFIENKTAPQVVGEYTGTRFLNAAVDYITGHDSAAAPLFLYLALHNTHAPIEAEPADVALYNKTFPWGLQARYYAMTTAVDRTVGAVVAALKSKGMWENTLLIWTTDNGAPVQVGGSNGGLRGGKGSNWEGGVRERAIFAGGLVPPARRGVTLPRSTGAFHVADAHATFLARAGLPLIDPNPRAPTPVDGMDVWEWVTGHTPLSPRTETGMPLDHLNFDYTLGLQGAYVKGALKLIVGGPSGEAQASWFGGPPLYFSPNQSHPHPPINQSACSNNVPPFACLFNLTEDPTEHVDLAATRPDLLGQMMADFLALNKTFHPPWIVPADEKAMLCATAMENDNVAAPWRTEPLPQDM